MLADVTGHERGRRHGLLLIAPFACTFCWSRMVPPNNPLGWRTILSKGANPREIMISDFDALYVWKTTGHSDGSI